MTRSFQVILFRATFVGAWMLIFGAAANAQFKAAASMRVITPNPLLPITGGMGPTVPSTAKRGELSVRALVVSDDDTKLAIVSVDSLGFPSVLGDRARAKITGIPAENVLIGATHTHSAPDTYAFPDGRGGHTGDLTYMQHVVDEIAATVNEAVRNLAVAELRIATGAAEGRIAYNYYAPDLYDRRVTAIQVRHAGDKKMIGTLVNYAIHPEVLGADRGIVSPDLIGPLNDHLENEAGGVAIFMNGAQGGMITADNRDLERPSDPVRGYWNDDRVWNECVRIGTQLASESLRLLADESWQPDPAVTCTTKYVRFPVESDDIWNIVLGSPLNYPRNDDHTISARIAYGQIGKGRFLTIPGEALPNIGFYLKRKMPGDHDMLFGLTNDAFGYILTRVDFDSFPRYDYVSRVSLGEETGEILISEALKLFEADESRPQDSAP